MYVQANRLCVCVCVFWVEEEKYVPPSSILTNQHMTLCVCVCEKSQGQFGKCCEGNFNWFTRPTVVRSLQKERGKREMENEIL